MLISWEVLRQFRGFTPYFFHAYKGTTGKNDLARKLTTFFQKIF